jgi:hypothetical protein
MSMSDVINDVRNRQPATLYDDTGGAPEEDNRPDNELRPTSMDTPAGLPPYIHIETLSENSEWQKVTTVLALASFGAWLVEASNK